MPERFKVLIGVPGDGRLSEGSAQLTYQASLHHDFDRVPSNYSGPNHNKCWKEALNAGLRGEYTHFVMVHTDLKLYEDHLFDVDGVKIPLNTCASPVRDICPERSKLWLDVYLEDMEAAGVPFLSSPIALKDERGLMSCGAGDPDDAWTVYRRLCSNELDGLPRVFTVADMGYPDKYLVHSFALAMFDLRDPCWYEVTKQGYAPCFFNFTEKVVWNQRTREFELFGQSEDYAFCRLMWRHGIRSAITRNVRIHHLTGNIEFPNYDIPSWGTYKHGDEDLAFKWRRPAEITPRDGVALTVA